jgi:hypothetical protein
LTFSRRSLAFEDADPETEVESDMAREHAVTAEENVRIPADALTLEGFRSWTVAEHLAKPPMRPLSGNSGA